MSTSLKLIKDITAQEKRTGVMLVCPHEFDVALCFITVENAALSFSLVGHPWGRAKLITRDISIP